MKTEIRFKKIIEKMENLIAEAKEEIEEFRKTGKEKLIISECYWCDSDKVFIPLNSAEIGETIFYECSACEGQIAEIKLPNEVKGGEK